MNEPVNANANTDTQERVEVDTVELKTIEIRISGVKEATQRSRFVFIILIIVAATILISLWNSILSWDRGMAFGPRSADLMIAENQRNVTVEWLKNMIISVGLLGIRVSAPDLAIIGSASLVVVMVWFFFSQRRENRAIVGLLRYCNKGLKDKELSTDVCKLVYEGIVQSIVFIDMGGGDKPIRGIVENEENVESTFFIRTILKSLVFLPPFTIFMIVLSDIFSLFIPSYLREDNAGPLWNTIFDGKHGIEIAKIIFFDLFAILAGIYTSVLCVKCRQFSQATADTIKEYRPAVWRDQ